MSARRYAAFACALGLAVVTGCSKVEHAPADDCFASPPAAGSCACPGEAVVDPTLLAFLSKARAAHHAADLAEDANDKAAAIASLEGLVQGARPTGSAPEVVEVLADARARLADLRSAAGAFDAAERDVDEGLRLATQPTHFRGHLYEVKGVVLERRAAALAARGDVAGADGARRQAVDAYQKAVAIQDEVIRRALPGGAR